jgi:hypothetical protein
MAELGLRRRYEIDSRVWLVIKVGKRGGGTVAIYEELNVQYKARGGPNDIRLHRAMTGLATSERRMTTPLLRGPGMAAKQREEGRGSGRLRPINWAGPMRDASE